MNCPYDNVLQDANVKHRPRRQLTGVVAPREAEEPLVLAMDVGTTSLRTEFYDRQGRGVQGLKARRDHEVRTTPVGASEGDPDAVLDLLFSCLDELLSRAAPLGKKIGAAASCSLVSNVLGIDSQGRAITPMTTYADTRSASEVPALRAALNEKAVHQITGCHLHPSYLPARLRWFARQQPDLFRRVARWISVGEYLELQLFGETAVSYSVASWTGLLDRVRLRWDPEVLAAIPLPPEKLSPLTDCDAPRRGLRPEFAARWPALAQVPWFPCVGDGATANIGSGCLSAGRVALTVGTSSAVRVVLKTPVEHVPEGLWCYRVDSRRSLLGGALSEGGNVFAWMRDTLQLKNAREAEKALAGREPGGHGLTLLPFLAGERSPGWAGLARAAIHGLTLATTPLDILQAGLEAVAYRIALVFGLMRPALPADPQVVASGGALLNSPAWLKIMADALGRPVASSGVPEASSRGAALLALEAMGAVSDLEAVPDFAGPEVLPDSRAHEIHQRAMERQQELYRILVKPDR